MFVGSFLFFYSCHITILWVLHVNATHKRITKNKAWSEKSGRQSERNNYVASKCFSFAKRGESKQPQ